MSAVSLRRIRPQVSLEEDYNIALDRCGQDADCMRQHTAWSAR
jgi:hypothetical protein